MVFYEIGKSSQKVKELIHSQLIKLLDTYSFLYLKQIQVFYCDFIYLISISLKVQVLEEYHFLLFKWVIQVEEQVLTSKFIVHFCILDMLDIIDQNEANDIYKPNKINVHMELQLVFLLFPCKYGIGIFSSFNYMLIYIINT